MSATNRAQVMLWLTQRGIRVVPCYKTQTIMLAHDSGDWVDVFEYDWDALYAQCQKWSDAIRDGKPAPWAAGGAE